MTLPLQGNVLAATPSFSKRTNQLERSGLGQEGEHMPYYNFAVLVIDTERYVKRNLKVK